MKKLVLSLLFVGSMAVAASASAQQRTFLTADDLGVAPAQRQARLAEPVRGGAFYRGFELASVSQPDSMGYAPANALMINGKKRALKTEFMGLVTDLGGIRQDFAPRDPVNKAIVYLATNHSIHEEGGHTGVFVIWKYNIDNGTYARLYSFRYDQEAAPEGYDIIGNEGTKLVILKNIDGPYCTRDIPSEYPQQLQVIDMRAPTRGTTAYTPSASMRSVFGALPACLEGAQEPTLSLSASNMSFSVGQTNASTLTASFSASQLPANSHLEIQQVFAGRAATLIATCVTSSCRGVVHGDEPAGSRVYKAYVLESDGAILYQSENLTIQVDPASTR